MMINLIILFYILPFLSDKLQKNINILLPDNL